MLPLLLPCLLLQAPEALPVDFSLPPGLRVKPDSLQLEGFSQENFEMKPPSSGAIPRVAVEGRIWRFQIEASQGRLGVLGLTQRLAEALEASGWIWHWRERGVASRRSGDREQWIRVAPGGSGELKVVLALRQEPRSLALKQPGPLPERPGAEEDFPYLAPWPGAKIQGSRGSQSPVALEIEPGQPTMALVNFIEKEYLLPDPPTPHEFIAVYRKALLRAGWEIEGAYKGALVQIQASYLKDGRDIRATLRLLGDALAISVADVGAQRPPKKP